MSSHKLTSTLRPVPTSVTRKLPVKNFASFSKLPIELRCRIWKLASRGDRIIRVNSKILISTIVVSTYSALSAGPLPTVLQINHESREEAKREYTMVACYIETRADRPAFNSRAKVYINFAVDTLYFCGFNCPRALTRTLEELCEMKSEGPVGDLSISRLAIQSNAVLRWAGLKDSNYKLEAIMTICMLCPSLVSITVVHDTSKFGKTSTPHLYTLKQAVMVMNKEYEDGQLVEWKSWIGGTLGTRASRRLCDRALQGFFEGTFILSGKGYQGSAATLTAYEDFKKKNTAWVKPEVQYASIARTLTKTKR